jgi:hypothetical protein
VLSLAVGVKPESMLKDFEILQIGCGFL